MSVLAAQETRWLQRRWRFKPYTLARKRLNLDINKKKTKAWIEMCDLADKGPFGKQHKIMMKISVRAEWIWRR